MKNIHLIPTDKARLYIHQGKLYDHKKTMHITNGTQIPQNICITSNEKPKANDWSIYQNKIHKCIEDIIGDEFKKIILTDNQELIQDGVQAIDDEFLEWYVKNPSYEEIEVSYEVLKPFQSIDKGYVLRLPDNEVLEEPKQETTLKEFLLQLRNTPMTFVPKEEYIKCGDCNKHYLCTTCGAQCGSEGHFIEIPIQKQHLIDMMRGDEELGLYDDSTRYAHNNFNMHETNNYQALKQGYEAGATEMANKMYTEKDLRDAYNYGMFAVTSGRNFNDWFKNFKKK